MTEEQVNEVPCKPDLTAPGLSSCYGMILKLAKVKVCLESDRYLFNKEWKDWLKNKVKSLGASYLIFIFASLKQEEGEVPEWPKGTVC